MNITIEDPEMTEIFVSHLILKKLKAHRPPSDPLRFDCEGHSEMVNLHGEGLEEYESMRESADAECREIVSLFRAAPEWVQRECLDGWNPKLLETTRKDMIDYIAGVAEWFPAVQVSSQDQPCYPHGMPPSVTTSLIDCDMPPRVKVVMTIGITKAEAMTQLERLVDEVDQHWDHIVSHQEKSADSESSG